MSDPSEETLTTYSLMVLGDAEVGKSALTLQLCTKTFNIYYDPTIDESFVNRIKIVAQN